MSNSESAIGQIVRNLEQRYYVPRNERVRELARKNARLHD